MAKKFQVINHNLVNNGGNHMVSVFEVFIADEKRTVWVNVDDEYATITTANAIEYDNNISVSSVTERAVKYTVVGTEKLYKELFMHCIYEHARKYCSTHGGTLSVHIYWLPRSIECQLTPSNLEYLWESYSSVCQTDGVKIYVPMEDNVAKAFRVDFQPQDLTKTLIGAAEQINSVIRDYHDVLDQDKLDALVSVVQDLEYWMAMC